MIQAQTVHEKHERHEKEPGVKKETRASAGFEWGAKAAVKDFPFVLLVYFVDKVFFASWLGKSRALTTAGLSGGDGSCVLPLMSYH